MPEVTIDQSKKGEVSDEKPKLPRLEFASNGSIQTNFFEGLKNIFKDDTKEATGPPKPFVKSMDTTGGLTVGFDQKIVPPELSEINNS